MSSAVSYVQQLAHPRVGGENERGGVIVCHVVWLIPAWAGKTSRTSASHAAPRAHPRVGGENAFQAAKRVAARGSSPRGRGKRDLCRADGQVTGLIPAWAGKTPYVATVSHIPRAHPRVGGENLAGGVRCIAGLRLIPAWAGKTCSRRSRKQSCPAHPRVGGENCGRVAGVAWRWGSSPRGRGKPSLVWSGEA